MSEKGLGTPATRAATSFVGLSMPVASTVNSTLPRETRAVARSAVVEEERVPR